MSLRSTQVEVLVLELHPSQFVAYHFCHRYYHHYGLRLSPRQKEIARLNRKLDKKMIKVELGPAATANCFGSPHFNSNSYKSVFGWEKTRFQSKMLQSHTYRCFTSNYIALHMGEGASLKPVCIYLSYCQGFKWFVERQLDNQWSDLSKLWHWWLSQLTLWMTPESNIKASTFIPRKINRP